MISNKNRTLLRNIQNPGRLINQKKRTKSPNICIKCNKRGTLGEKREKEREFVILYTGYLLYIVKIKRVIKRKERGERERERKKRKKKREREDRKIRERERDTDRQRKKQAN